MSNDNNPFKSIEEKFLERQRAKQNSTSKKQRPRIIQKHQLKLKNMLS